MLMESLQQGGIGASRITGAPPADGEPFAVWGQRWLAAEIIPAAYAERRPFWHLDNGYYDPAGGFRSGYYRMTYRGLWPVLIPNPPAIRPLRAGRPKLRPWRTTGGHILVALPGESYGVSIGLNMPAWIAGIRDHIRPYTDRPILWRPKGCRRKLSADLLGAWALVTHSSNVAVEAVLAGYPVFVAATNPAAPVGNLDLSALERPQTPERGRWLASLLAQQFTVEEMANGAARPLLEMVRRQVDGV